MRGGGGISWPKADRVFVHDRAEAMRRYQNLLGCDWTGESIRIRGDGASRSANVGVLRSLLLAPLPPLMTLLPLFLVKGDCNIRCFHSSSRFIDSSLCEKHVGKTS